MSKVKTIALATVLIFGAGTASGSPGKAQNNNRGPGKNTGGPGQGYQ
jgi:hypothetical protein